MSQPATSTPEHVAIIMDGNGRWARERGLPRKAGHRAGAESVREAVEFCISRGIRTLTLYAFSSENWSRPEAEIEALMRLLERFLKSKAAEFQRQKVRLQVIGQIERLPASCQEEIARTIEATARNEALTLVLALSYGSREEITAAARRLAEKAARGELDPAEIGPAEFAGELDTAQLPDPDLLIRTSGEMRLSNFLLWQLSYAEIVITPKYWPDFKKNDFDLALTEYQRRHRRFGGL
ncbi:MAG: isoprenyl transferase [Verrucomicrobiales bacterium]